MIATSLSYLSLNYSFLSKVLLISIICILIIINELNGDRDDSGR